jgi:hypothetical protein
MRSGSWCFCWWHSTSGSVPNQEHFFRALGGSVRDLRTRKGTPCRQRQFRRQQPDQESLLQSRCEVQ